MEELDPIRRRLARWCLDNSQVVGEADPQVPDSLDGREADNWTPLLAIADAVGGSWPEQARRAALEMSGQIDDEASGVALFADLQELFGAQPGVDRLTSKVICAALEKLEGRPWPEWRQGKPLTLRGLASLLRPFGVEPRTIKLADGSTGKGYHLDELKDAWGPYLPPQKVTNVTDQDPCGSNPLVANVTEMPGYLSENGVSPAVGAGGYAGYRLNPGNGPAPPIAPPGEPSADPLAGLLADDGWEPVTPPDGNRP